MIRSISITISYILLVVVSVLVDVLLISIYITFLSKPAEWLPQIAYDLSQGPVYGVYMISPCTMNIKEYRPPGVISSYIVIFPCVHISLINLNPVPTDVVLIAHISSPLFTGYKVLDLLGTFDVYWDNGNPPDGVSIVSADYLGPGIYRSIRLNPGVSVSFRIPLIYGGTLSDVLACTRTSCVKLHTVSGQILIQNPSASWILYLDNQTQSLQDSHSLYAYSLTQTWMWRSETLGGRAMSCVSEIRYGNDIQRYIIVSHDGLCCGTVCPSGSKTIHYPSNTDRRICSTDTVSGYMISPSSLFGYPPRILVGFFTTDHNFRFNVSPHSIELDGKKFTIYGFDSRRYSLLSSYSIAIDKWLAYKHKECNRRIVTLEASIFIDANRTIPLSTIYRDSRKLYIYGVTRGYVEQSSLFYRRYDNVNITVIGKYIDRQNIGEEERVVVTADRTSSYVTGYTALDIENLVEVIIRIRYEMIGEEPFYCYTNYLFGTYCGKDYERHVRLAFYIELIPDEFLR
ncbi:MAG: hypothetical protein QXK54_04455 [Ignisphaera sp.]